MKREDILNKKIGKDHGFRTPEGFLEELYRNTSAQLPERKPIAPIKRTTWQTIRPYVYLAAMFAGIWCTMKMVSQMQISQQPHISLDNPPALVAQAISAPEVVQELELPQQANDAAIISEAAAGYDNIEEFEEDFNYEFNPQVDNIDVDQLQQELSETQSDKLSNDEIDELYYDYYAYL